MLEKIRENKQYAVRGLKEGLERFCADDLTEVLVNLDDGTCDYQELIPLLEEIARADLFCYFDDNGAGGFPRADSRRETSFRSWALRAIENIRENAGFAAASGEAQALKSLDTRLIKSTLGKLIAENACADRTLIPILEKIARKDVYHKYSYYEGFKTDCRLGALARDAIQMILRNAEK